MGNLPEIKNLVSCILYLDKINYMHEYNYVQKIDKSYLTGSA